MRMTKKEKEVWEEIKKNIDASVNELIDEMYSPEVDELVEKDLEQWRKENPKLVEEDRKLLEKQSKW